MFASTRGPALLAGALMCLSSPIALADDVTPHGGMLRYPDVSRDHIVFLYANDLWTVPRDGGVASPLASPPGEELFPRFSSDGKTIAFVGNYEGGRDLYTVAVDGGIPVRVTHHPAGEVLCDWTPNGDLLFFAGGIEGHPRGSQLFRVGPEGGMPEKLPVPYGASGAISPDGAWLAYTPHTRDQRTWKRYRGGMSTDIWLLNLSSGESVQATDWEGTDTLPMWNGKMLYYLSDGGSEHRLNIWSYDPETNRHRQITSFDEYDVKWPSIGPGPEGKGEIVFQLGPELRLLDLGSKETSVVDVRIPGARPTLAPKRVNAMENVLGGDISATGQRAVVSARGDVWTLPAENGPPRNLTRTDGTAERSPSWSPDGRWIAYFSDASGEYELYVTQSDGKGETKQLTDGPETFYFSATWSPDSKRIATVDKAGTIRLHTVETGETEEIDTDPWGQQQLPLSWSHDSRWIAYARTLDEQPTTAVNLYDTESGERHQVTTGIFTDTNPVFDRKGDYLYFASTRSFNPTYSDLDTTFVYRRSQVLVAVPLRADVERPWKLEIDEETWKDEEADDEEKADDAAEGDDGEKADDADEEASDDEGDDEGDDDAPAAPPSPIHGIWEGTVSGLAAMGMPEDSISFTMTIIVAADRSISGWSEAMGESSAFDAVTFDEASGAFSATRTQEGVTISMAATLADTTLTGTWEIEGMGVSGAWNATRTSQEVDADEAEEKGKSDEPAERVEIDVDGFEARAFQLPIGSANFGNLAVNDKNQLLYIRADDSGAAIKLFDLDDDKKAEKNVAGGAGGFAISGDGKKILIQRGQGGSIQNASAGASGKPIPTTGVIMVVNPRDEWKQIFTDAWRIQRDFFYVDNLHGVDWDAVYEQYLPMLDECVTREEVSYVIREMISELNVGHAYYFGGDGESQSITPVGLLGVDYELDGGAYRISAIQQGAAWDVDARNPLAGLDVNEGDYLLAVNGVPLDTTKDPWAAFIGLAGRPTVLTVSANPEMDDEAREVIVRPIGGEGTLRYRGWIEANRAYVEAMTDGQVGYIYVPNTGVDGQSDLVRQYFGQIGKKALIVDERWNGGGQIPTRFIEMLNRPVTNYWARRDGKDWSWPPDAHRGPKCMLINGLAGSGGDMFPWLFKQAGLGPLIGTRTWGGLVGISGNPPLIDGGYTSVPTFGFYETDGTWGIEGHGVDPDYEVIDDPALMLDGGDPQLDKAIELMLEAIEKDPYTPPKRPADPDRSGMGIKEKDK